MVENQIVIEWISKADGDFEFASTNLKEGKTFFAQICFHFQQAAEKYLKASFPNSLHPTPYTLFITFVEKV